MLIQSPDNVRDIPRIKEKLRMATGVYVHQVNRAVFNQNKVNPVCLLCGQVDETLQHFLFECASLASVREPIIDSIYNAFASTNLIALGNAAGGMLQLVLDHTMINQNILSASNHQHLKTLETNCRRLCYALHSERYKRLQLGAQN